LKKRFKWLYYIILIIPCLEIALLILGYRSYTHLEYNISSKPTYCLLSHNTLGFSLKPGAFEVSINNELNYSVSHGKDSTRKIPFKSIKDSSTQKVYFFGCSYTYGMGVNDNENFPALVQQKYLNLKVKNFGVPGYGTIQSYLKLKGLINNNDIPDVAIINYADFHDMRNSLSPQYRLNLKMGYENSNEEVKKLMNTSRVPFVNFKSGFYKVDFCKWEEIYTNWFLRETLASVNYFQSFSDKRNEKSIPQKEITLYLFNEIRNLCDSNNIKLIINGITSNLNTRIIIGDLTKDGYNALFMGVDLTLPKYNNLPLDSHPNKLAHKLFADKVINYLPLFISK
jgi:hypothetical protein